ncbi:MAG: YhjD/YihY/BrkB family envelope integrity protein [Myxococcota bacterium]
MTLVERLQHGRHALSRFVREDLWNSPDDPRSAAGRALRFVQFGAMIGEGFVRDRLMLRASALAYFTVLALIPLVAIAVSLVSALGVQLNLSQLVVERIAAGAPGAQQYILELIEKANFGGLGTLGAAALFITTIFGVSNVERALNSIWGVKQERSWARRLPDYLAVLVVAPLLLGTALSLSTTLQSQWLFQRLLEVELFATLSDLGLRHAPTVMLCLAFAFLYWFLPNTRVRLSSALLGGAVAGVAVMAAQSLYLDFSIGVARYNALFGGFAALPLLFVWIYVFWAVTLFGAEVAFAHQNLALYRREVRGRPPGAADREAIGLRIALEAARAFRDGAPALSADWLADAMSVPVRTVRDVLAPLEEAGIVAERAELELGGSFQLGRPAERVQVSQVLAALRGSREELAGDTRVAGSVEHVIAEIEEGAEKGAAGRTLADLLADLPPDEAGQASEASAQRGAA